MFLYMLVLLNVFMLFFTFSSFSDKKRIFAPLAEAISAFLCLFMVTSGIMWIFECFTVEFCVLAVTFLILVLFVLTYYRSPIKGKEFFSISGIKIDHRVVFNKGSILIAVFLSLGAYSTFGIGFNDGNAQMEALSILDGKSARTFEIEEYKNIRSESKYEYYFFDTISNIDTENFTADYWLTDEGSEDGEITMWADYGANPVYPSVLALSGLLFGKGRMAFIQAVFAFCLFVFVDEILRALKCDWKLRSLLVLLLGVSPIVVYCNHTTLIEPVIGFCMIMFVYFLLCKENKLQIVSSAGVVAFSFLHTSVYTMLPLFLVIYWMYYIHTRKVRHLISTGIVIAGYVLSFVFLNIVAYDNTSINYRLGMPFFKEKYFVFVIIIAIISVVVATILIVMFSDADADKMSQFERTKGQTFFKVGVIVLSIASIAYMTVINIIKCESFNDTLHITIIAYAVCSGMILLPYILVRLISGSYVVGIKEAVIVVSFIYTVLFYSSIMKVTLEGYYYEARYLASFIPFIILVAGMMLKLFKEDEKYFIPVIGIIILLMPYTTSLLSSKAERRLDKEVFERVTNTVEDYSDKNTVILIEKDLMKYFYFPVLNKTEAKVYPFEPGYINSFCLDTQDASSKVLYISNSQGNAFRNRGVIRFLSDKSVNEISEDDVSAILGLPNAFYEKNDDIIQVMEIAHLYRMVDTSSLEELTMDDIDISIDSVEIDEKENAHLTVSITDGTKLYHSDALFLSYHLEYEDDEVYDNPRTDLGVCVGVYTFDFDLASLEEGMTVVFDVVEEDVQWYSWNEEVPSITFNRNEDGEWEYSIEERIAVK